MRWANGFGSWAASLGAACACATGAVLEDNSGSFDSGVMISGDGATESDGESAGGNDGSGGVPSSGGTPSGGGKSGGAGGAGTGGSVDGGAGGKGAGGAGAGGKGGAGGKATGGTSAGGSASGGGGGAGGACNPPKKVCDGSCMDPNPQFGCGPTCAPNACPLVNDAYSVCDGTNCGFDCKPGFAENTAGDGCVSTGAGGSGAGGGPPACTAQGCPDCFFIAAQFPCCKANGTCGCQWPGTQCF